VLPHSGSPPSWAVATKARSGVQFALGALFEVVALGRFRGHRLEARRLAGRGLPFASIAIGQHSALLGQKLGCESA